jgi:glycosyltransferase involved in cell wall biosynthesis
MIKLLTFSTLYPSSARPNHGIFVETRLRHLLATDEVQSVVVAPVPWFPFGNGRFGEYAKFAFTPQEETRNGIRVLHPRYPLIPKVGMTSAPFFMAMAVLPALKTLLKDGYDFDVIDAHYFYPDGVAAVMLGKWLGKPVVITARGSDINLIANFIIPRRLILWAGRTSARVVTVCEALRQDLIRLGIGSEHIITLRNGVDLDRFRPVDRTAARAALKLSGFTLLSVGALVPRKGHDIIIKTLTELSDAQLVIIGEGPERKNLQKLAQGLGVANRVNFMGALPQSELRGYYGAADALVLASSREGWANVLLETMACGTPVVASAVSGTPEVVTACEAGVLMRERTPHGIVEAVERLRRNYPDRHMTRAYAQRFSWDETTAGQLRLFEEIIAERLFEPRPLIDK